MLSRVLFGLSLVASLLLSSSPLVSAQFTVNCDPITVDAFAVLGATSGSDTEGSMAFMANASRPNLVHNVTLAQPYDSNKIFFNILLTANVTSQSAQTGLTSYGFYISLNGVAKNSSSNSTYFALGNSGEFDNIEFTNWKFDMFNRTNITNVLQISVQETFAEFQGGDAALDNCYYNYTFYFVNPQTTRDTGANVVGDPQFKGLRGQSFQVHGVDGAVYNLISDADQQLNSRFTFLEGPRPCPVMPSTGKQSAACWSHPGSYLSELALKTSGGDEVLIVSGEASQGFASVQVNGKSLSMGSTAQLSYASSEAAGSIQLDNSHELVIRSGLFEVIVENNDGFVNLRSVAVSAANWPKLAAHGLLGQTWQNKRYGGKIKEIEGDVDDYLIEDEDMFGTSFIYNKFTASA